MPRPKGATAKAKAAQPKTVRDREFYSRIGRLGGAKTAERGQQYYAEIGRKGGTATKTKHGATHYTSIGTAGGRARHHKSAE